MSAMKKMRRMFKKQYLVTMREIRETKAMVRVFLRRERHLYPQAFGQLWDIVKIFFLLPILLLPGSVVILTLLELLARLFRGTIFPRRQRL